VSSTSIHHLIIKVYLILPWQKLIMI
jgi:hypothetical protein